MFFFHESVSLTAHVTFTQAIYRLFRSIWSNKNHFVHLLENFCCYTNEINCKVSEKQLTINPYRIYVCISLSLGIMEYFSNTWWDIEMKEIRNSGGKVLFINLQKTYKRNWGCLVQSEKKKKGHFSLCFLETFLKYQIKQIPTWVKKYWLPIHNKFISNRVYFFQCGKMLFFSISLKVHEISKWNKFQIIHYKSIANL